MQAKNEKIQLTEKTATRMRDTNGHSVTKIMIKQILIYDCSAQFSEHIFQILFNFDQSA